jgi:hypothetical protein
MSLIRFEKVLLALLVALSASLFASAARAYTADEEQACSGDAFRLCSSEIPNVDRITACMERKKAQLSPACRAFFRSTPATASAQPGKPTNLKPVTTRKPGVKSSRSKKPAKPDAT